MEKDNTNNQTAEEDAEREGSEELPDREGKSDSVEGQRDGRNHEFGENSPDEIIEQDRPRNEEYKGQVLRESAGDNLEEQNPTQDQTSGEDDVGGLSDEEYDRAEGE